MIVSLIHRFFWSFGSATFEPPNFFAYLTIQSNAALAIVTIAAGVLMLRGADRGRGLAIARGSILTCVVTSGIVFAVILQQSAQLGIQVWVPWSDIVLHFVVPVLAALDWILIPRARPGFGIVAIALGYTGLWGVVTIVRGALVEWYPYYFLDPRQTESPLDLIVLSAIAVAVFAVVGVVLALLPPRAVPPEAGITRRRTD